MVSEEEYEYSAFKCAFCKTLNPAKKLRPVAPRLPVPSMPSGASAVEQSVLQRAAIAARAEEPSSSTSTSDKESSECDYFLSFAKKKIMNNSLAHSRLGIRTDFGERINGTDQQ